MLARSFHLQRRIQDHLIDGRERDLDRRARARQLAAARARPQRLIAEVSGKRRRAIASRPRGGQKVSFNR
jgi:hypothetical protein